MLGWSSCLNPGVMPSARSRRNALDASQVETCVCGLDGVRGWVRWCERV